MPERRDPKLVGVYESEEAARAAADAARRAGAEARVGDPGDEPLALEAEMREEMEHTIAGPGNVGPFTKEMNKGILGGVALGTLIGVVIALPLAFVVNVGGPLWIRLLIVVFVGAAAGSTLGFVLGGGLAAKRPSHRLASERGVIVSARSNDPAVAAAMSKERPVRLDTARGTQPTNTVETEEGRRRGGVVEDVAANVKGDEG